MEEFWIQLGCIPEQWSEAERPGIDNSVRIYGSDHNARESLAQYIARCPISLDKITYEDFHGKVLFKTTKYNDYFKENFRVFDALDFIALVTCHIPPKHKQLIRRYGVYASRSRGWSEASFLLAHAALGKWETQDHLVRLAPEGWKEKKQLEEETPVESEENKSAAGTKQQRSAWARLIKKVYGFDPLCCPKCHSDMKIIAIIMEPEEI